ncbi:hypothetical protein RV18_GL003313 [Enterococcus termitis]|nr:hypothetical protein RV18_GL003313 [Enterococcus termitis]
MNIEDFIKKFMNIRLNDENKKRLSRGVQLRDIDVVASDFTV